MVAEMPAKSDKQPAEKKRPPWESVYARIDAEHVRKLEQMAEWDRRDSSDVLRLAAEEFIAGHYEEFKARAQSRLRDLK